jgi:hypothetical protein
VNFVDPLGLDPCTGYVPPGTICVQTNLPYPTGAGGGAGVHQPLQSGTNNISVGGGGGFFSGFLQTTRTANQCAGRLSQAGSVSNLSGGKVPTVLGSNTFGDIASLATGGAGLDQGAALAADAAAHALPAVAAGTAVRTAASIGTPVSLTAGVYNPVTVGTTTVTLGMTTAGKILLGAAEGVLTGKVLLDAGVYIGALVVCSQP